MRRYSITYFIGQSIKGLWRNGVMSSASIMVLMSCLVVMGSFALLVYNINYNMSEIANLNEILVHVDTSKSINNTDNDIAKPEENAAQNTDTSTNEIYKIDSSTETAVILLDLNEKIDKTDAFIDINTANKEIIEIKNIIDTTAVKIEGIPDTNRRAQEQLYFQQLLKKYEKLSSRLSSLASIELTIRSLDNVVNVTLTSKQAGIDEYSEKYPEYPDIFNVFLNDPTKNPLNDRFTITYNDNSKIATLQYKLEHLNDMIYKVECRADIAQTIESIKQGIILIFSWFLAILFIVSIFVIINTIKLAVFARRQEISIMRYVGATNWFIMLPFIFEGVIIGLIASVIAYFVQYYIYIYVQSMILDSSFNIISIYMFDSIKTYVAVGFLAIGILTGIMGSSFSLRKYMKA